jgi:hypothetical protein
MEQKYTNYFFYAIIFTMLGMMMNLTVITFNDGEMPVKIYHGYLDSDKHFAFQNNDEVHNWYLADVIKIDNYYVSIGDIMMILGTIFMVSILVIGTIKKHKNRKVYI